MRRWWVGLAVGVVMIVVGAILYAQEVHILGFTAMPIVVGGLVAVGMALTDWWMARTNRFR